MDIRKKINQLPSASGVYIMKSRSGEILYIGKASSLRQRVKSHFSRPPASKPDIFREEVADIAYLECDTPEQALILEAALIKEKKPRYNVALKDNKSYPYIEITREEFPRVFISRPKGKNKSLLFGPYPETKTLRSALLLVRRIFPYRSCPKIPKRPCLFFHLKLCPAPCSRKISSADYRVNIESISRILKGERRKLAKALEGRMKKLVKNLQFEQAAHLRDKLSAINNLYRGKPRAHAIVSLKEVLKLPRLPLNIEAVDISSLGSRNAAGSIVVFKEGVPVKKNYRRFRIKDAVVNDDYAMVAEVVRRRYLRLIKENKALPDLVIVDGGKGHAAVVSEVLIGLGLSLPVVGLAKKNEEIWFPRSRNPVRLSRGDPGLQLIQRIRDEAHRFAHNYQVVRRRQNLWP